MTKNKESDKDQDTKMPEENLNTNQENDVSYQDSIEERLDDEEKKPDNSKLNNLNKLD